MSRTVAQSLSTALLTALRERLDDEPVKDSPDLVRLTGELLAELDNLEPLSRLELKATREHLGLSQHKLAEIMNVARNSAARWETGENRIPRSLTAVLQVLLDQKDRG